MYPIHATRKEVPMNIRPLYVVAPAPLRAERSAFVALNRNNRVRPGTRVCDAGSRAD